MSDMSTLSELARFVGQSALTKDDATAQRRAVNAVAGRMSPRPVHRKVADLLGVVLALSSRTRRMVLPRAEIELDVFSPKGGRAVYLVMPRRS